MPHVTRPSRRSVSAWGAAVLVAAAIAFGGAVGATSASAQVIEVDVPERDSSPSPTASATPGSPPTSAPGQNAHGDLPPTGGELLIPWIAAGAVAVAAGVVTVKVARSRRRAS